MQFPKNFLKFFRVLSHPAQIKMMCKQYYLQQQRKWETFSWEGIKDLKLCLSSDWTGNWTGNWTGKLLRRSLLLGVITLLAILQGNQGQLDLKIEDLTVTFKTP